MFKKLSLLALVLFISACEVPEDAVLGIPQPSVAPSESPNSDEPPCYQQLQCIIENTTDNALRRSAQEVITDLFQLEEPQYTELCQAKAEELVGRVSVCERN